MLIILASPIALNYFHHVNLLNIFMDRQLSSTFCVLYFLYPFNFSAGKDG